MQLHNLTVRLNWLTHQPLFSTARLLSPADIQAFSAGHDRATQLAVANRWVLVGDCSEGLFGQLKEDGYVRSEGKLEFINSKSGFGFGVLTNQIAGHQHRFVLPLWDPRMSDLIEAMQWGDYSFCMALEGTQELIVFPGGALLALEGYQPPLGVPLTQAQALQVTAEMPAALAQFGDLGGVASMVPGYEVEDVSVSVLVDAVPRPAALEAAVLQ